MKIINLDTRIYVSKLKHEIEKATLAKFVNNVKDLLDDIFSNYSIIMDKGECHEDYVRQIFRAILLGKNVTLNRLIEMTNVDWDTKT